MSVVFACFVWPTRSSASTSTGVLPIPTGTVTENCPSAPTAAVSSPPGARTVTDDGVGKTPIEVEAEDLVGHTKQATTTLTRRPPPPPALRPEATDLWKKQAEK